MPKTIMLVLLCLVILFIAGCQMSPTASPTDTPMPSLRPDQLQFENALTGQRLQALDGCAHDLACEDWTIVPYRQLGNFYQAKWCKSDECVIASGNAHRRDQHIIQLDTLFYPNSFPQVFGLGINARFVPPAEGWGASFSFHEKGKTIVGEGFGLSFAHFATVSGPAETTLRLGPRYSYTVHQTDISISSTLSLREELAVYLSSAQTMRDRGSEQLAALAAKVESTIENGQVIGCDYGPYNNDGIAPECFPRPLTKDESVEAGAAAQTFFEAQQQTLRDHFREMYAALLQAFPLDRCWPD